MKINFERLKKHINELAQIGRDENFGINRIAFSKYDLEARNWLTQKIKEAGLDVYIDGAANIHGRLNWNPDLPSIITGSHIDTVIGGGHLDGSLGVLTGLECLTTIKEHSEELSLQYPYELISFSDEEGRFGPMFGSSAFIGDLNPQKIINAKDLNGITLVDAMKECGYNAFDALNATRKPETIHSYMELHIEQGPVLDSLKIPIGIVTSITGLFKWMGTLTGRTDHAGTTPLHMRRDALAGLSELILEIPRIIEENGGETSVATVGKVDVYPGAANSVPGIVKFSLDVRDPDSNILLELEHSFRKVISAISRRRKLMFQFEILSEIQPEKCSNTIINLIQKSCNELGYNYHQLHSGAAHDAQNIAKIADIGMIFVPSKNGRSHSAQEWTDWEDIEKGANVMLNTLLKLQEVKK